MITPFYQQYLQSLPRSKDQPRRASAKDREEAQAAPASAAAAAPPAEVKAGVVLASVPTAHPVKTVIYKPTSRSNSSMASISSAEQPQLNKKGSTTSTGSKSSKSRSTPADVELDDTKAGLASAAVAPATITNASVKRSSSKESPVKASAASKSPPADPAGASSKPSRPTISADAKQEPAVIAQTALLDEVSGCRCLVRDRLMQLN